MRDFEMAEVQKLIDAWMAAHPGITVTHSAQSFDTARADYLNAAPAGTAPDILRADIGWTIGFADQGFLLDLTGLVATRPTSCRTRSRPPPGRAASSVCPMSPTRSASSATRSS